MEKKYSKTPFDGYTYSFRVFFEAVDPYYSTNKWYYSNCGDFQSLEDYINEKKTDKVISFKINQRNSKEQDDLTNEFIEESLKKF